ncbi:FKBP-type peptidyl-prolyl cis-trans isomerase [Streptomyces sp. NY05-11A]|uniref:FKBP-type peptidyl-prolyl cis-trans isomerase n=1 Tax=Streptomyces soliscabiei TaxID=588897 RepID=UPI0029BE6A23|nr:FKBP-type peptidyl-prolyl cis-trans isomerase [Streptomyces sp. NY05-11A]MDX2676213.1 FKBP-type peptidyl-prolyl cis-trans isomerase [Streptomyces sp. NY05-11A]
MRRRSLILAAVPAGLVTLSACGDDKSDSSKASDGKSPSASGTPAPPSPPKIVDGPLPAITAGVKFGEKPTIAKGSGEPSDQLAVKTVIAGSGKTVAEGDYIQADFVGQIWSTAKVLIDTFEAKKPQFTHLAQGASIEGWRYALTGRKTGSRVLFSVPPTWGFGKEGNAQAGIKGTDTLVFVFDIQDAFGAKSSAKGKVVAQGGAGVPKVGTNTDGKAPSVEVPKSKAPTKLVAEYVIEGDGAVLAADDTVLVQYKGVIWNTGKEFDSTYSRKELTSFSLQQVVKGWAQGLIGRKVGSRVVIVVPPALGYGDNPPQGSGIGKDDTMVFAVDILAKV